MKRRERVAAPQGGGSLLPNGTWQDQKPEERRLERTRRTPDKQSGSVVKNLGSTSLLHISHAESPGVRPPVGFRTFKPGACRMATTSPKRLETFVAKFVIIKASNHPPIRSTICKAFWCRYYRLVDSSYASPAHRWHGVCFPSASRNCLMDSWRFNEVWRYREALWNGLLITVELNLVVLAASTVLGFLIGALRLSRSGVISSSARVYVDLFRSFPVLVLLVWLFFALPLLPGLHIRLSSFTCAALGLTLNLSAFVAEICRAGILAVPVHHIHSAKVMGFSRWQIWRRITGPISFRIMIAPLFGQYINQIKLSVLASVIAVPELLHTVNTITTETFRPLELYTTLAAIFLLILIPCTYLQGVLETQLSKPTLSRGNGNGNSKTALVNDENGSAERIADVPDVDSWKTLPRGTSLNVDRFACGYGSLPIFRNVSFRTEVGTVTAIIGPNGGGKSTLVKSLSGVLDRIEGKMSLSDGERLDQTILGYVSQEHDPWPHLSVEENLILPLVVAAKKSRQEARDIATRWLAFFHLEDHAKARPYTLSGGQRQRLVLARTLCLQPQILLLDEPTSAMDFRWTLFVNKLVRKLADTGLIVLAISHGGGFVRAVANNVVFLDHGTVAESGPAAILAAPQTDGLKSFLEAA